MKHFVMIFHQGSKKLSETDLRRRTEETRGWAQCQNVAGHKLNPHILEPEGHWCGVGGASGLDPATGNGPITALLFFEANDFAQAIEVAESHPAIRYGSSVEVRPWAPPALPSTVAR